MKKNILIKALSVLAAGLGLTSCLDGDPQNFPYGQSPTLVAISYVQPTGNNFNTGLQFFSGQTLLLSPADSAVTVTYGVAVEGAISEDVNVTVAVDASKLADNKGNDGLDYQLMDASQFKMLSTTGVIHPGTNQTAQFVEFQVVFYPPAIDFTKSWMLPITVTNDKGITVASNFQTAYFHVIGNPIAGLYDWQYHRVDTPDGTGAINYGSGISFDFGHTPGPAVFVPQDPTTIQTFTGYAGYVYNYIITFDDDNAGNLTNFKAVIDPATVNGPWKDSQIVITSDPVITVSPDYSYFKIHFHVQSGAAGAHRDVTDEYQKL